MLLISGIKYRSIPSTNNLSFYLTINLNNTSGYSLFGFSGLSSKLDFLTFKSGKVIDYNQRHVWSYNPNEDISISGNIGESFINYFINNEPICLYSPVNENNYYNNFYIQTQNTNLDSNLIINSNQPNYAINFPQNSNFGSNITGNIINLEQNLLNSFRIFSGDLQNSNISYTLSLIPTGEIFGNQTGNIRLNFTDSFGLSNSSGTSLLLTLNTNFGNIQKEINITYNPTPLYFLDFVQGFTGITGLNLDQGLLYNYELQSIDSENKNFIISLSNFSGHTGQQILEAFNITGNISGEISGFVWGSDFITGTISGLGVGNSFDINFFENIVSGVISAEERRFVFATGNIDYYYNLLFTGGSGFGPAPENTKITGYGFIVSPNTLESFIFKNRLVTQSGTGILTGLWGSIFQSSFGTGFIQDNKFYTGNTLLNYKELISTGNNFEIGLNSFTSKLVYGMTGQKNYIFQINESGEKLLDETILYDQITGKVLDSIIPFKTVTDFNLSGIVFASLNSGSAPFLFYNNSNFWFTNATTPTGYVDFDFSKFPEEYNKNITHYEINLDLNSNYLPYVFSVKGFNSFEETPILLDQRTGENFYASTRRIFELQQTGNFKIIRFEITSGLFWPHRDLNPTFPQGIKINKIQYFTSNNFSGSYKNLSPILSNNKFTDFNAKSGNIYISQNTGCDWGIKEQSRAWIDVDMTYDAKIQSAIVSGGYIYVSYDSGQNWNQKGFKNLWKKISISKLNGQYQFAVSSGNAFLSSDSGNNWNIIPNLPFSNWSAAAISENGQYISAAVYNGRIFTSPNFGENWINGNSPTVNWSDLSMSKNGQSLIAVVYSGNSFDSNAGRIFRSSNAGVTWASVTTSPVNQRRNWVSVDMSHDGLYNTALEETGNVFISNNYGSNWSIINLTGDWQDLSLSYSGDIQSIVANDGKIRVSNDYGVTWYQKNLCRPWKAIAISDNGLLQTAVAFPPYIEVYSSNKEKSLDLSYYAFDINNTATVSGVSPEIFLTYKSANPLDSNYQYFYIEFEQGFIPPKVLLQQSRDGNVFINAFEKSNNISKIETGVVNLHDGNQYFKWVLAPNFTCDNSGVSDNINNPILVSLNTEPKQTKICGSLSGNAHYYYFNNDTEFFITNIGFINYSSLEKSIFSLQSGSSFSQIDSGQNIVSGYFGQELVLTNLLTSLNKKTIPLLNTGTYNIEIKSTGIDLIDYELVILLTDINSCTIEIENAGFNFNGESLNGIYSKRNRFTSSGTWNGKPYYENGSKRKSIWWNGNFWVLGAGRTFDPNPNEYAYIYASGCENVMIPSLIQDWKSIAGRPTPNFYSKCS